MEQFFSPHSVFLIITVLRRFVPQLCTKTPDKQIQNVESTSFTRKKKHKSKRPNKPGFIDRQALTGLVFR